MVDEKAPQRVLKGYYCPRRYESTKSEYFLD